MKVITVQEADIPRIMDCAVACCNEHGEDRLAGQFNPIRYESFWRNLYRKKSGIVFAVEHEDGRLVGGIGGMRYTDVHTNDTHCLMVFWYFLPEFRNGLHSTRLWRNLEQWAVEGGCRAINAAYRERTMPERAKQFYERSGYSALETIYRKKL